MTSLQILILVASTIAGALGQAKNSGDTPKAWIPYLTMGGAFLVAFAASLGQAGVLSAATALAALSAGVQAIGSALFGVVAHIHLTSHQRDDGSADSGKSSSAKDDAPAAKPPMNARGALVGALSALLVLTAIGCGWWSNGGGTKVGGQIATEGACVLAQIESGNRDPISIGVACVGGALGSVVTDIESLIAYYITGDGGGPVTAGATVCAPDGATPPYAGAPRCISGEAAAALLEARTRGRLALAAKGGQ